jgi:hypothetical protein
LSPLLALAIDPLKGSEYFELLAEWSEEKLIKGVGSGGTGFRREGCMASDECPSDAYRLGLLGRGLILWISPLIRFNEDLDLRNSKEFEEELLGKGPRWESPSSMEFLFGSGMLRVL